MDFINITIIISIVLIILNFVFFSVIIFDTLIRIPFISSEPIYVPPAFRKNIDSDIRTTLNYGNPILILFIIFYIIFYIIYLIILNIIPDTGFPTFFIPLKELLLKIPPLPSLIEYGVFKLFDSILDALKLSTSFKRFIKINLSFMNFSRDNIKNILKMILKDTDIEFDFGDDEEEKEKSNKEKPSKINKEENPIYRQIDKDVNICYLNNKKMIDAGMSEVDKKYTEYANYKELIKCKANSIGKYIRII
jgi:hypothetical protein